MSSSSSLSSMNNALLDQKRQQLHDLLVNGHKNTITVDPSADEVIDKAQKFIHQSLRRLDVISPFMDDDEDDQLLPSLSIKQSIPFSSFSIPACLPPITTIVPLRTLPYAQRSKVIHTWVPSKHVPNTKHTAYNDLLWDDDPTLVEVPCSILSSQLEGTGHSSSSSTSSVARRPLTGNLSTKLVEYTRGQIGKRNPFRPGGLIEEDEEKECQDFVSSDDKMTHGNNSKYSETMSSSVAFCLERKIQARDVLKKGILASYKDHTLLTAPSGVPFTIGLHPRDFFPSSEFQDEVKFTDHDSCNLLSKNHNSAAAAVSSTNQYMASSVPLISSSRNSELDTKQLLEDLSLFEDSSSERDLDHDSLEKFEEDSANLEDDNLLEKFDKDSDPEGKYDDGDDCNLEKFDGDSVQEYDDDGPRSLEKFKESSDEEESVESNHGSCSLDITGDINVSADDRLMAPTVREERRGNVILDEGVEDLDSLLHELSLSTETSIVEKALALQKKTSKSLGDTMKTLASNEALATMKAQKKALTHSSDNNLSWAVTSLLPLQDFHSLVPNPAMTYPFELDDFQKQAVARLERGECIFVAAHTSAGKTVCAEYAIALSRKHCTRTIYTSPIKALSNQKYRDFKEKFGEDVGIITGDVQIGADASCLIMTTEILRSMLYRGADLVRDIEFVIFDEVHYINDSERGVVYEEVIIMLPDYVKLIFLSATTPNTVEFSEWIGRTKQKHVHVIRTDYRPVPLSHYLYAGQKLHKIMEANRGFIEKGWSEAAKALIPLSEREKRELEGKKKGPLGGSKQTTATTSFKMTSGSKENAWQQPGSKQEFISLVKFLEKECLMPTVVFSFSRKKCEELAYCLRSVDLNNAMEKSTVHILTTQASARLSHSDAKLPQVLTIIEMVKRGIGVHHSGLLPLLKEIVEILFSKNLIKVLFATETFAMGVNFPTKAVVFNAIRKHDGIQHRFLQPGEYVQMGGRAGRRGLDKVGTVIITCFGDEPPPAGYLRQMLTGTATKLLSQFRLTYNMILNLLRVEDMSVESMIKRSFSEFATQRALGKNEYPKLLAKGMKTLAKLDENFRKESSSCNPHNQHIENYYFDCTEMLDLNRLVLNTLITSGGVGNIALPPGRVILVNSARRKGLARSIGVVLRPPVNTTTSATSGLGKPMVCLVLLPASFIPKLGERDQKFKQIEYVGYSRRRHYAIKEIELNEILMVTDLKIKLDPLEFYDESIGMKDPVGNIDAAFSSASVRNRATESNFLVPGPAKKGHQLESKSSQEDVISRLIDAEADEFKNGIGMFDFKDALKGIHHGQRALDAKDAYSRMVHLISDIRQYTCHKADDLVKLYAVVEKKETLRVVVQKLRYMLSHESLQLFPDFMQRKSVLHKLGYVDENDTVSIKGRVACEVNTCEEIIVTELVFSGVLNTLTPAELAACLSALVFQEKNNEDDLSSDLPQNIIDTCKVMREIATKLGVVQKNHGLNLDPREYCDNSLKFGLVHVVYEWAMGVPFRNICELTSVQEGSIVRCITRLDELCREVRNCARVVGNPTLYQKAEEASATVKRDIVFVASLYIN